MAVKWKKKGSRFKPEIILRKIDSVRTVSPEGKVSFSGFDIEDCLPALYSMLEFPAAAAEVDLSRLVWSGLAKVKTALTAEAFLTAVNKELSDRLSAKEQTFSLLTAISLDHRDVPKRLQMMGAEIRFLAGDYPTRFRSRDSLLRENRVPVSATPTQYCKVVVKVKAKSPSAAVSKALRALDLQRAIWCLMNNPQMQLTFGTPSLSPINVARLGSQHTLHLPRGERATDAIWYDPGFAEASIFRMSKPNIVTKNSRWMLQQISSSQYGDRLSGALIRYVRALDDSEPNAAFIRLWGALESLTTPEQADYDKLVRRCSFIFKDRAFNKQILEHLREFRNASVHAGEESERGRIHCYQLQYYFASLIWFHLHNARIFQSLEEANFFLDFPTDQGELKRRIYLSRKALRFIA